MIVYSFILILYNLNKQIKFVSTDLEFEAIRRKQLSSFCSTVYIILSWTMDSEILLKKWVQLDLIFEFLNLLGL